jgi:glycosyltransferase involved in cell wall biosynthesis
LTTADNQDTKGLTAVERVWELEFSMRIALASIHPRPLSGQIEGLVGLAQALQKQGHAVTVVSAFPGETILSADRLNLVSKQSWSFVDHPFRIVRILAKLVHLSSHVDLIQLNLPTPAFSTVGDLLQALVRVPVIVYYEAHLIRPHDLMRLDRLREAASFYLPRLLINNRFIARLGWHRAARYVVSSKYQKAELRAVGIAPSRISLLPGLMPSDKLAHGARDAFRTRHNLVSARVLTYVGHYNHVKGVDVIANAFRLLAPRLPDLHLVMAWSGMGKSRCVEEMLRDPALAGRVTQLGRVNVPELLAASDVIALPYRLTIGQAAHPAALLEALVANVPVVTSDLPLLRELTNQGETAMLAPPEDPSALAAAVERLLTTPSLRRGMSAAQAEWKLRNHPQRVVKEYERLYEQVTLQRATFPHPVHSRANTE